MQTITINGKTFVLVPEENLVESTPSNPPQSILSDFIQQDEEMVMPPVDDGLADNKEKEKAIRIVEQEDTQDVVAEQITAPKAQPKPYAYRERYLKQELLPSDVMTFTRLGADLLAKNPEDPMIKADAKRPKSQRLFYGAGGEQEG